jgi:hypothetical protein
MAVWLKKLQQSCMRFAVVTEPSVVRGSKFRSFVHPSQRMDLVLEAAGLVRAARRGTLVWAFELYRWKDGA